MTMENQPLEDVYPIKNGDFTWVMLVFLGGCRADCLSLLGFFYVALTESKVCWVKLTVPPLVACLAAFETKQFSSLTQVIFVGSFHQWILDCWSNCNTKDLPRCRLKVPSGARIFQNGLLIKFEIVRKGDLNHPQVVSGIGEHSPNLLSYIYSYLENR